MKTRQQVEELWDAVFECSVGDKERKEKFIDFFCEEPELPKKEWHFEPDDPYLHLKLAQAAGKVIQWRNAQNVWVDCTGIWGYCTDLPENYRIKPEEKKLVSFEEALQHYRKGGDARLQNWDATITLQGLIDSDHGVRINKVMIGAIWELLP